MPLIDGETRSAQVVAAINVLILSLIKDGGFRLVEQTPPLALQLPWKISPLVSQRLRRVNGQLAEHLGHGN